jgi:DNA-binding NarL/FixJ family response regulator
MGERDADMKEARLRLRAEVRELDRVGNSEKATDESLTWPSPLDSRWTLLDRFEAGGRRYVIAATEPCVELSSREQEVIALAAAGASNKEIAHSLGVAHATVRVLLSRAAAKLNVKTRTDLITAFRRLAQR